MGRRGWTRGTETRMAAWPYIEVGRYAQTAGTPSPASLGRKPWEPECTRSTRKSVSSPAPITNSPRHNAGFFIIRSTHKGSNMAEVIDTEVRGSVTITTVRYGPPVAQLIQEKIAAIEKAHQETYREIFGSREDQYQRLEQLIEDMSPRG